MSKKQSSWDFYLDLLIKSVFAVYFIIANAYLGSQMGWWNNEHAWIFTQGMLIVLGFLSAGIGLNLATTYITSLLNPPPPQPKKSPLQRISFEKRPPASPQHGWRKAKDSRLSHSRQNHPPSDLPF